MQKNNRVVILMKAFCKRCLLDETDPEGLYLQIQKRIAMLDEDQKTDKQTYALRLEKCTACDKLSSGMCALCGCFVELRAAKADTRCPDTDRKW